MIDRGGQGRQQQASYMHRLRFLDGLLKITSLCLLFIAVCQVPLTSAAKVSISGRQLIVNGQPFYARGVCYEPTPRGQWPDSKDSSMSWDWFSSPEVYNRDIPLLKQLNVNVVRLYGWRTNVNHTAFLDACYAANIYVIAGFRWKWDLFATPEGKKQMRANLEQDVTLHASHPAILAWTVGNELNLNNDYKVEDVWAFVKELKDAIHAIEAKLNTWHPVGSPVADGGTVFDLMKSQSSSVDLWMAQLYKGKQFWDFFTKYSAAVSLPLMVTEYGVDSWDTKNNREDEATQADWVGALWQELVKNNDTNCGGLVFAWSDGWFGCQPIDQHDTCGGNSNAMPDGVGNEEWFGIMSISNPQKVSSPNADTLRPKQVYSTLQNLWKGYAVTPREPDSGTSTTGNTIGTTGTTGTVVNTGTTGTTGTVVNTGTTGTVVNTGTTTGSTGTTGTAGTTGTTGSPPGSSGGGLSKGAIAGIVIAALVGTIVAAVVVAVIVKKSAASKTSQMLY